MKAKRGLVYSILCVLLLGAFLGVSQSADATSGSITIEPGQTKYLSFGTCAGEDILLWDLEISTLSTIFEYWLQMPDGTHLSLSSLTYGKIVGVSGEWKLGFSIDESGWWSATVYYTIYRITPRIEISTPGFASYTNETQVEVSGTVDSYADNVAISFDKVHYEAVDLYLGNWNGEITLPSDGYYDVWAEATFQWGSYVAKYYDVTTVRLDTILPEITIVVPDDLGLVRTNDVGISWQCSDDCGIWKTEVKIDGKGWGTVTGNTHDLRLATGEHTIQIRITDLAGNQATDSTTFTVDARVLSFDGPYYGLPLVGIVLGAVVAVVAVALLLQRRRGGAAIATVPSEGDGSQDAA